MQFSLILLNINLLFCSCCKFEERAKEVNCSFGGYKHISVKYPVKYFYFTYNNLTKLEVFENVTVTGHLFISNNNIEDLEELNKMSGLFSLVQIIADYNKITRITEPTFYNFKNLTFLSLSYNKISSIDKDAFKFTKKLKWVYLEYNNIKSIDFIHNLHEVKMYVNLSNNSIDDLNKLPQVNLSRFEKLVLSGNKIEYIENAALRILNSTTVDLSRNYFCCNVYKDFKNGSFTNIIVDENLNITCKNCSANFSNEREDKRAGLSFIVPGICIICLLSIIVAVVFRYINNKISHSSTANTNQQVVENEYENLQIPGNSVYSDPVRPELDEDGYLNPNEPIYEEIK